MHSINLGLNFDLNRDRISFNRLFGSKFVVRIQIVATKLIPAAQKKIEKFEIGRLLIKNREIYRK